MPAAIEAAGAVAGGHKRRSPRGLTVRLAVPAPCGYFACIVSAQYTIRTVPKSVDRALRQRAKREAKSLNTVVVEALARGLEIDTPPVEHRDLDALIGSWQEDKAFDRAISDFERVDEAAWK